MFFAVVVSLATATKGSVLLLQPSSCYFPISVILGTGERSAGIRVVLP